VILLKNLVFTVLVPGTVAGLVPYWIASSSGHWGWQGAGPLQLLGSVVLGGGLGVYLRCLIDFGSAGGTPAPIDPPKELVVHGLYRYSRNPMYVGVLSIIAGQALILEALPLALYACAIFAMFHAFVVLYEEPTLRRQFGQAHERLCARVPRWLGRPRPGG
jgi:protein-S-isoprenylcysteine O-methyltransferase Ste14